MLSFQLETFSEFTYSILMDLCYCKGLKTKENKHKTLLHKFSPFVNPSGNNCVFLDRLSYEWALFFPLAALITVSNLLELCDSFQTRLWMFKHGDFHLQGWRTIVYRNCWYVDCERITQLPLSVGTWDVCVLSIKLSSWSNWWRKESETFWLAFICVWL